MSSANRLVNSSDPLVAFTSPYSVAEQKSFRDKFSRVSLKFLLTKREKFFNFFLLEVQQVESNKHKAGHMDEKIASSASRDSLNSD